MTGLVSRLVSEMEASGLRPREKEERECAVADRGEAVRIKQEGECNEEPEGLKQEPRPRCATHEPGCEGLKQEPRPRCATHEPGCEGLKQEPRPRCATHEPGCEGLKQEPRPRCATHEPASVKQEACTGWEDGSGLYADHDIKEELVLGPENLQRLGIALTISGAAGRALAAETAGAEQEIDATHKLNTNRNIVQITTYMCDICSKLFIKKTKLIRHIERHLGGPYQQARDSENALFCKTCNKRFRQVGHLNRHERSHAGAGAAHACPVCDKRFTRPESVRRHAVVHSGRKPHACGACPAQFTQLANLARHKRIHTGEKPYACEVCSRRFTQSCDLKKHMRIHTGVRPYACDLCSKRFTCSGDLRTHKRTKGHKRVERILSCRKK